MNKLIVIIFISIFLNSCSISLMGTYKDTACCAGMGCEILKIKKNNKYEYISWGDLMGVDTVKGYYKRRFNKIILSPIMPFEYTMQKSFVKIDTAKSVDSTLIQIYSLPAILTKINSDLYNVNNKNYLFDIRELNKIDTISEYNYFKINKKDYETDTCGKIKLKLQKNDTIEIFELLNNELSFTYVVNNENIEKLSIFCATNGYNPYYYKEEFKKSSNGFYSINEKFPTHFLSKKNDKYKCFTNRERKIIRDSLFELIVLNIDKKVFIDAIDEEFYIIFNKKGKIKKVIVAPYYGEEISFSDNLYTYKQRKAIKKAGKNFSIPGITKINYNVFIKLVIDYDDETDSLRLNHF